MEVVRYARCERAPQWTSGRLAANVTNVSNVPGGAFAERGEELYRVLGEIGPKFSR